MPFFRVRTAFCGPPVIPLCKDIRFHVIAGYPDYGSSYHFYGIVRRRPQKGCFLRPLLPPVPSSAARSLSCRSFLPSLSGSACAFVAVLAVCSCFCCLFLFLLLLFGPVSVSVFVPTIRFRFCHPLSLLPSASASAVRSRSRRPVPSPPSFPACAVRFSGPLPGDEKACGHNRAAGFPEQALLPFGERYSASSTNTALS